MKEQQKESKPTDEEITRFIEERFQLLEETGQVNNAVLYNQSEEEIPLSFSSSIKKMFHEIFIKTKKENRGNANI